MIANVLAVQEEQAKLSSLHEQFLIDVNKTVSKMNAQEGQIEILEQSSKRSARIYFSLTVGKAHYLFKVHQSTLLKERW